MKLFKEIREVDEGTWKLPKSSKEKNQLKALMKKPIPLGKDGDNASDQIDSIIGDDSLLDDLHTAGKKNPKGDARPIIQKAMKRLGIKEFRMPPMTMARDNTIVGVRSEDIEEERMNLSSRLYKQFKKDIDKIMKKHDAYVSDSNTKYTTISSPKPMKGGFKKDLFNLLGMTEDIEEAGDYGRGGQKGSANIRNKSYFDSSVGRGWISALRDTIKGNIMVGELLKAFPGLKKSDIKPMLKSSELRSLSKDWMLADRDIKKVLTQVLAKVK